MKIKAIDRKKERDILIGMITDDSFIAQISTIFDSKLMKNPWTRTVAKWCLEYFKNYEIAPKGDIQKIFEYNVRKGSVKDDEYNPIEQLLDSLNEDYTEGESHNTEFLVKETEKYFNSVSMENDIKLVEAYLEDGKIEEARAIISQSKPIALSSAQYIDPILNREKLKQAFENCSKPLLRLDGHIGLFMNKHFTRGSFVVFQAPEKMGKSFQLQYIEREALKQGLKVLSVQIGDLTDGEVMLRHAIALSGLPDLEDNCGTFKRPVRFIRCVDEEKKECKLLPEGWDVEYEEVTIEKPLDFRTAWKHNKKFYEDHNIEKDKNFRLITSAFDEMTITHLRARILDFIKEGFSPDVVVVDYMDVCGDEPGTEKDTARDKIFKRWKLAKRLPVDLNILLVSATQANATTYDGALQGKASFSDDKRKNGQVNAMAGINATDQELKAGLAKLNGIVFRKGECVSSDCCYLLRNLRQGWPVVDSLLINAGFRERAIESETRNTLHEKSREKIVKRRKR